MLRKITDNADAVEALKDLVNLEEQVRVARRNIEDFYNPSHHPWVKIDMTIARRELLHEKHREAMPKIATASLD